MSGERCPDCGAPVGGREGCQAFWDELGIAFLADPACAALHDPAFDAYCLQHPDRYCRSAKSYAAHLARLCCWMEHGGDPRVYRAIQQWLNGAVALAKPEVLSRRGEMTIADVAAARSAEERAGAAAAWARGVWAAYATQQELARAWIRTALHGKN